MPTLSDNLSGSLANEYDTNLPVSGTGHHISRIKSSFELFCALVWDLAYFKLKTWIFLIRSTVSGAFLHLFSHWQRLFLASKRWSRILIVCTSYKTSYNVQRLASLQLPYTGLDTVKVCCEYSTLWQCYNTILSSYIAWRQSVDVTGNPLWWTCTPSKQCLLGEVFAEGMLNEIEEFTPMVASWVILARGQEI